MHCTSVIRRYAAYYIAEDSASLGSLYLYPYYLLVCNAELLSVSGSKVDMSLSNDNALADLYLAAGTYELASAGVCNVSGLSYGSCDTDGTSVCSGKLYLSLGTYRTEDRNALEVFLRTYDSNSLLAGELTGLRKVLLLGEFIALAEEYLKVLLSNVDVTCRCFNDKIF